MRWWSSPLRVFYIQSIFACSLKALEKTGSAEESKVWHFVALLRCFLKPAVEKLHVYVVSEELCLCLGNS